MLTLCVAGLAGIEARDPEQAARLFGAVKLHVKASPCKLPIDLITKT
jgi:hypothetical protein